MRRFPITRKVEHEDILDLVRRAGRALHGERWQVPLSRDLGVSDRALRYWIDGTYAVPVAEVLPRLLEILQERVDEVATVAADIRDAI
jgi:hypothetical protein